MASETAPVYRYFVVDLISNSVLAEIPFKGVSYERALKGAGSWTGSIPFNYQTKSFNLYDSTMPGKTALYVMRNDKCVWGGIIWSRSYDVVTKQLSVNASEFTSYFHHRRIWKTWNTDYKGDVYVVNGVVTVKINDGLTETLSNGSSFRVHFNDPAYWDYNGYYTLTAESTQNTLTGEVTLTASNVSIQTINFNSVTLPDGTYLNSDIFIRTNTYDYVRSLVNAVSKDFYGTYFPNTEIQPAKTIVNTVTNRGLSGGIGTLVTTTTNTLVPGQEFILSNVGTEFDGYHIANTVVGNTITYDHGGAIANSAVPVTNFLVTSRSITGGLATLTTNTAHNLYVGQKVNIAGVDASTTSTVYNGYVQVASTPTTTSFTYNTATTATEFTINLAAATTSLPSLASDYITAASWTTPTLTITANNSFVAGQVVSISGINNGADATTTTGTTGWNLQNVNIASANSTQFTITGVTTNPATAGGAFNAGNSLNSIAKVKNTKITGATADGTTVTYTANNAFKAGQRVSIGGVTPISYNLTDVSITSANATAFTVTSNAATAVVTSANGTGTTITYQALNNFTAGQTVTITGITPTTGYNLTGTTIATANATAFTITNATTGAYTSGGLAKTNYNGAAQTASITSINGTGSVVTYKAVNSFVKGMYVTIAGATAAYNLVNAVIASANSTQFTVTSTATGVTSTGTATVSGQAYSFMYVNSKQATSNVVTVTNPTTNAYGALPAVVTNAVGSGTVVTYTANNSFVVGQRVSIQNVTPSAYNLTNVRVATANATAFTVSSTATGTYTNATVGTAYTYVNASVTGIYDSSVVTQKAYTGSNTTVTLTTNAPHGYSVGKLVTVSGIGDVATITASSMTVASPNTTFTITTNTAHNLVVGNTVSISNVKDVYTISSYSYNPANSTLVVTTSGAHNIDTSTTGVTISGLGTTSYSISSVSVSSGTVTLTTSSAHSVQSNQTITVSGFPNTPESVAISYSVKQGFSSVVYATTSTAHSLVAGQSVTINVTNTGAELYMNSGTFTVLSVSDNTHFTYNDGNTWDYPTTITFNSLGTASYSVDPHINGSWTSGSVGSNTIDYYSASAADLSSTSGAGATVTAASNPLNKTYDSVTAIGGTNTTFSVSVSGVSVAISGSGGTATVANGVFNGTDLVVTAIPSTTQFQYVKATASYPLRTSKTGSGGQATIISSLYNTPSALITGVTTNTFSFTAAGGSVSKPTTAVTPNGVATSDSIITGNTVGAIVVSNTALKYTVANAGTFNATQVYGYATGVSTATITYGTYGPFTKSSDLLFDFSTAGYSATQTLPVSYRGYQALNVGEELDKYSDIINGFEYRVDCSFDTASNSFKRTFVLLPIFPDSLTNYLASLPNGTLYVGTAAPASAFGADKFVFQFPGNILSVNIEESAENSATRFFMVGNIGDLGGDISQPVGVASNTDLLNPTGTMTRWPVLDDAHSDSNIYDEDTLYNYAQRYLAEAKPPDAKINITVNGSTTPVVGTYAPGDWCTLIIDDEFINQRLKNDLEPRDNYILRKIDAVNVTVPDGVSYPEEISLTLVPEWQADQIGK